MYTNAAHIQESKHSLMSKSLDCWVAALSQHPEFMSALWMQAGKQQTASQRSGCWSRTVTRPRPQKWLFVAAGNAATFPNIKSPGILFLTSSLSAEIKWTISIILSLGISVTDCGWERDRGRYTKEQEQLFRHRLTWWTLEACLSSSPGLRWFELFPSPPETHTGGSLFYYH